MGQNKPAEAEPLLVAAYEGLKQYDGPLQGVLGDERIAEAIHLPHRPRQGEKQGR